MRKTVTLLIGAASVAALLAITACKQFTADIEEELGYWAAEVIVADYSFSVPYQMSNDGALCIPSEHDVTLTIKLRNPKNFTIVTPASADDAGKVIDFPGLSTQPVYGTDYTLNLTTNDTLKLTYTQAFLQAHEWSNGSIGPEITLISTDGRKFNKKFSLNIEANTPPPEIGDITIAKTNEADPHYVLCFTVQDTDMGTIIAGENLHNDLSLVIAKEGEEPEKIPLTVESSGFTVDTTKGLLSSASQIIDPVPSGTWKVYFKTDTKLTASTLPQKYTVRLIDRKGLSSESKEAKTLGYIPDISGADTAWKNLKQAVEGAQEGGVITVMGNVKATNDTDNSGAINVTKSLTIKGKIGTTLDANQSALGSNAHRIFTVTGDKTELTLENLTLKNGYANPGGLLDYRYGGAISASQIKTLTLKNCVIANCTAYGGGGIYLNGGVEAVLERCTITECETTGAGGGAIYAGASGKQPIVRIKGGEIKNNTGHILGGAINITRGSLYINTDENGNPDNPSTTTEIENNTLKASGGGGGIYCYWDEDGSGELIIKDAEIKNCKIKYAPSPADGTGRGAGISVYGNGKVSLSKVTLSQCGFIGETAADKFTIKQGGGICLREVSTATIEGCTIENSTTADEGGGIYATDSNLTIENTKIQNNRVEKKGGGVYLAADGTFTMSGSAQINTNNDVYLSNGKTITVSAALTGTAPVARITVPDANYAVTTQVLGGNITDGTPQNYTKFTVTPQSSPPQNWYVGSDGKLKKQ